MGVLNRKREFSSNRLPGLFNLSWKVVRWCIGLGCVVFSAVYLFGDTIQPAANQIALTALAVILVAVILHSFITLIAVLKDIKQLSLSCLVGLLILEISFIALCGLFVVGIIAALFR